MKHSLKATSIIESLIVLLIVVSGIVGVFGILNSSQKLASSTTGRIDAIQIARDGLEAMTNIRDTNSKLFAADLKNCWNVMNYDSACIGDNTQTTDITLSSTQGVKVFRNANNQFEVARETNTGGYTNTDYRNRFRVSRDSRGFYTQSGGTNFLPLYTREIQINYLNADNTAGDSNSPKMKVTAIIQWNDTATGSPKKLEMTTLLTNWRGEK